MNIIQRKGGSKKKIWLKKYFQTFGKFQITNCEYFD